MYIVPYAILRLPYAIVLLRLLSYYYQCPIFFPLLTSPDGFNMNSGPEACDREDS